MLLKSIKMTNLRSYEFEEVKFPVGSVLLAGDIGSGKSTILHAIEFALFGAKKGELPAYTLLKHGKKEGSAELRMQIGEKDITIKRNLKRTNSDIKQDAGYVIINGIKKDGTAEEIRAIVLKLLGYPKELIKKGKDLIYRYTVYTPQEAMKQILYDHKEIRLNTLRKVFNIDKYKRIKDNSKIILSSLKDKKRYLDGFVMDIDYKKKDYEKRKSEIVKIEDIIKDVTPKLDEIKNLLVEKRQNYSQYEMDINELLRLKKELSVSQANLTLRIEQNNRLNDEIKKLDRQIEKSEEELKDKKLIEMKSIVEKIGNKDKEIRELEAKYRESIKKTKGFEVKIDQSNEAIRKINSLDVCPICEQKVNEWHKQDINSREKIKHDKFLAELKNNKKEEEKFEALTFQLKKEIDNLLKDQNSINLLKLKFDNLAEKRNSKEEKVRLKQKIKKEVGTLNSAKIKLISEIEKFAQSENDYKIIKKEIEELLPEERFFELEIKKYETERSSNTKFLLAVEKEIDEKQKAKEKLNYLSQLINWIGEFFINLMSNMEKHVMVNIHSQFNGLFKSWFDILMEDETISVRVDEEFTPIIDQDGYETYIENLSGGEKTSVALSYRLALNKVINDVVAEIKTKDIIMLDEPTDGFSSEQLDKVRDVISQLNIKQVIIVSHEGKIEGFVDNIIRIEKQDNLSMVT